MVRRNDSEKRRQWEQRLRRFRSSGLTISRFCLRESVGVHSFHYWAKRIRATSPATSVDADHDCSRQASSGHRATEPTLPARSQVAMVQFEFDAGMRIILPAHCLEAIRCLLEAIERPGVAPSTSFRQVIVRNSTEKR
jgi:hypothetical protein